MYSKNDATPKIRTRIKGGGYMIKISFIEKLKIIRENEEGYGYRFLANKYNISKSPF